MAIKTSTISLPLHTGKCPKWLFAKMRVLARCILEAIIIEHGRLGLLKNLADGDWFQAFGCILGFDWHSSGLTTTTTAALKEANPVLKEYGIFVCGGKAKTALKTPQEIASIAEQCNAINKNTLVNASRLTAKVDNCLLIDGYSLYHHTFIFDKNNNWVVIQQGLNKTSQYSRRYHWFSQNIINFAIEPHNDIVSAKSFPTINIAAKSAQGNRQLIVKLAARKPKNNIKELTAIKNSTLPRRHAVFASDINPQYLDKIFLATYQHQPKNINELLQIRGVGPKTMRALSLIADLIYSQPPSFKDPARFSFAHGGKDGHPYRIDLQHYQETIGILDKAIKKAKIARTDKIKALRRIYTFYNRR